MPTPSDVRWNDVLALFRALGADCQEREGSRFCVALGERKLVLHRPHPGSELRRAAVRDVRDFLLRAGVAPP